MKTNTRLPHPTGVPASRLRRLFCTGLLVIASLAADLAQGQITQIFNVRSDIHGVEPGPSNMLSTGLSVSTGSTVTISVNPADTWKLNSSTANASGFPSAFGGGNNFYDSPTYGPPNSNYGALVYTINGTNCFPVASSTTVTSTTFVAADSGILRLGNWDSVSTDNTGGDVTLAVTVTITPASPEIALRGNAIDILNGDTTPSATDHTSFGSVVANSGTVVRTFTISNPGASALTLSGTAPNYVTLSGTGASHFSVTTQPASATVAASGGTQTFQITYAPTALGTHSATVSIASNDADENPFTFAIQGTGQTPAGSRAFAWGMNVFGQIGNGTTSSPVYTPSAVNTSGVLSGKTIVAVCAGDGHGQNGHSVALTSDGGLYAWGANDLGQLGNGTTTASSSPVAVDMTGVLAGKTVTAIAAGHRYTLALASDGSVYAWGDNGAGQLGDGTTTTRTSPVAVNMSGVLAGKTVTALAAGSGNSGTHSLALTSDGKVYGWGLNNQGQIGDGTSTNRTSPVAVNMTGVLSGKIVTGIAAGGHHSIAVTSEGKVYAWGNGYLGNGSTSGSTSPVVVDMTGVLAGKTVTAVSAGFYNGTALALTTEGKMYSWGSAGFGQLGDGASTSRTVPVEVVMTGALAGKTVIAISTHGIHAAAVTSDGDAYAWGWNGYGQLGNGSGSDSNTPTAVTMSGALAGRDVLSISTAVHHCIVIAGPAANTSPTDITLTPASIAENNTANATVGTLAATDADVGQTHTFSFVTGTGDTDNASFTIAGNALKITPVANFEVKSSYSVRVQADDSQGGTFAKAITISITNVNEAPLITSNAGGATASINVAENTTAVTTVVASDSDLPAQTITYSKSGTHAALFNIGSSTGVLTFAAAPDFETNPGPFSVTVTATDNGSPNLSDSQDLTISVTNVNEVPSFTKGADQLLPSNTSSAQIATGWATAINDGDSTVTQALSFNISSNSNPGIFTTTPSINSSTGTLTYTPNGTAGTATIGVTLTDDATINGNAALTTAVQTFTITVEASPNYNVTTTGNAIVVTDMSGNGDTLSVSEPSAGNIQFAAAGRTFSVNGGLQISGNSGALTRSSVTSITVNAAAGADTINVGAFTGTLPGLTVNGGTGDDTVNLNGDIIFVANANLDLDLQNDDLTPGTDAVSVAANANLLTSGTGAITVKVSKNISLAAGSSFETQNGNLTLTANQGAISTPGAYAGIKINGALSSSGSGNILLTGRGGATAAVATNRGIELTSGHSLTSTGTGQITLVGTGGTGPTDGLSSQAHGVLLVAGTVSSSAGNISITGVAGAGTLSTGADRGVAINGSSNILATGSAGITIVGTGGTGVGTDNHGVAYGGASATVSAVNGDISITGTASTASSHGLNIVGTLNFLRTTGTGSVTLTGTASGAGSFGFSAGSGTPVMSFTGADNKIIADSMNIAAGTISAANGLTLRQQTNGTLINLGAADSAGTLGLTDAELDLISAGTLAIGDANSGAISISSVISPADYKTLDIQKGVTFTAAGGFASEMTSAAVFEKIRVNGAVSINAAPTLSAAAVGGFVPAAGDAFTIIDNITASATTGTFSGKPESTLVAIGGVNKYLSYFGGTGNDVVLGPPSPNANLINLTTTAGALSPTFASGTTSYTVNVSNTTTSTTVTPTVDYVAATVTVNGTPVTSGSASGPITLNLGANVISTVVTAQNGTTKTYTITVIRAVVTTSSFAFTGSIQTWIVPAGVTSIKVTSLGAQGGGAIYGVGGNGASITGTFAVVPGQVLKILTGGKGADGGSTYRCNGGGGGGSFVWNETTGNVLYTAAGGGGGLGYLGSPGGPGSATQTTTNGGGAGNAAGGSGGNGGAGGSVATAITYPGNGGGGAGWLSNGGNGTNAATVGGGGFAPLNGGFGGSAGASIYGAPGGFGGGGGSAGFGGAGGGGGGYNGGGGGKNWSGSAWGSGGGGGSFNGGSNPINLAGVNAGNGLVSITYEIGISVNPDIQVEQPVGTILADGVTSSDFGTHYLGSTSPAKTFTITNTGTNNLTLGAFTLTGNSTDFSVNTSGMSTVLIPGGTTTFSVTFSTIVNELRTATLHIASDVFGTKNPFDIILTGTGANSINQTWPGGGSPMIDVPPSDSFDATGLNFDTALGFAPTPGTPYTFINIQGAPPAGIIGNFNDLPDGGVVAMSFGGVIYYFQVD